MWLLQHLFVYGTLAPGRSNHHVVRDIGGTWQRATLRGRLVEKGWGSWLGYPAIIPDDDGNPVHGYLFSSPELDQHWARLDAFEGDEYVREPVTVATEHDERIVAFVYAVKEPPQDVH